MSTAKTDILIIPGNLKHKELPDWIKDELAFESLEKHKETWEFDYNCEQALVYRGIGKRKCPVSDEWAVFIIAGSIIAALSGKHITPVRPEPYDWGGKLELFIWKIFWETCQDNSEKLDHAFLLAMLRDLFSHSHYCPPDRSYCESVFANRWTDCICDLAYPGDLMHPISYVREERLFDGQKAFQLLPKEVQISILEVAQYTPVMLDIAIDHIRQKYQYS